MIRTLYALPPPLYSCKDCHRRPPLRPASLLLKCGAVPILSQLFGLGGIWWATGVAEALAAVTLCLLYTKRGKYHYA